MFLIYCKCKLEGGYMKCLIIIVMLLLFPIHSQPRSRREAKETPASCSPLWWQLCQYDSNTQHNTILHYTVYNVCEYTVSLTESPFLKSMFQEMLLAWLWARLAADQISVCLCSFSSCGVAVTQSSRPWSGLCLCTECDVNTLCLASLDDAVLSLKN